MVTDSYMYGMIFFLHWFKLLSYIKDHNIFVFLGYLEGYVNESSVVPSLMHCQMRCDTLHLTCKSLNYVENEDGSNICEINYEAQYCALPGNFIVKENSYYVETMPENDAVSTFLSISLLLVYKVYKCLHILHLS